jgi:hypothetical protein
MSNRSSAVRLREVLLTLCLLACPLAQAQQPLSAESIRAAASAVAADPLMPGVEKTRRLRFKEEEKEKPKEPQNPARWWMDLLANLSTGLRVGMWLLGAGLLVWVLLRLREWLGRAGGARGLAPLPPTHVGTLDIRPQSLPDDIGGAARSLWQAGEARGALSLLYRGALSRLVHGHGVAIRAASTERECLALARPRLAPAALSFVAQLVAAWQTVAYAGRRPAADEVEALCRGFDLHLPRSGS